jgi:hypothetical protein
MKKYKMASYVEWITYNDEQSDPFNVSLLYLKTATTAGTTQQLRVLKHGSEWKQKCCKCRSITLTPRYCTMVHCSVVQTTWKLTEQYKNYCHIKKWNFIKLTITSNQNCIKASKQRLYNKISCMEKYSRYPFSCEYEINTLGERNKLLITLRDITLFLRPSTKIWIASVDATAESCRRLVQYVAQLTLKCICNCNSRLANVINRHRKSQRMRLENVMLIYASINPHNENKKSERTNVKILLLRT